MSAGNHDCIRTTKARGLVDKGSHWRRIVVAFDDETFEEIAERAVKRRRSFAAEVREIVELGLETAKEMER